MDILTALKNEASKLQKQLDTVHAAMKVLGKQQRRWRQETAFVSKRESEKNG